MAFQSPLIAIPKKTTQDVDWSGPIRQIIAQSYGEDPNIYSEECSVLQRCRQDAVRGAGSDQTARDLLYKYFGQLELLELRFAEIKVPFAWHDCFTEKLTTQTSLAFEKASIIHFIASILSSLAQSPSRSDPEGLKRAYFNSRASAGMLTYINENFLHAPSTDLGREVVHLMIGIMMAQATEIFTEKLVEEKKAPALVSRSANTCAAMYNAAVEEMKEFQGKGVFDRNWLYVLQIKAKLFASLAQYYRSVADTAASKHGSALVRMKLADTAAQDAQRQASSFAYTFVASTTPSLPHDAATSLQEITKAHATLCSEAKAQATRDNDLIYHEVLPSEAALPAIDKLPAAAPITIQEVYGNPDVSKLIGPDIFIRLVPLAVHESASVYSEEKAKLVRAEVERVELCEGEIRAGLEHLGLPGQVTNWRKLVDDDEEADGDVEVSGQIRRLAEEASRGEPVDAQLRRLESDRERCERELRELSGLLDNESRECERMRAKYAPQFTQSPSGPHTSNFRSTITSNLGALSSAASSDSNLISLWKSIQPQVNLLASGSSNVQQVAREVAKGRQPVAPSLPSVSLLDLDEDVGSKSGLDEKEKEDLRKGIADAVERLDRLSKIRRERDEVLKDLKEKVQNDDVSSLLLLNRRSQNVEPQLFASELEKFRPYQGRLAAAVQASKSLVQELEMLVRQLEKGKGVKERQRGQKDRARRIRDWERKLEDAGQSLSEIHAGLGKGFSYYDSLGGVVDDLKREVKLFVSSREAERNKLVSEIETRQRLGSPAPPSSTSGSRGLEERLAALSVGSSSYSPSLPQPPRSISSTPSGLPPPPPQPTTPYYAPPPPSSAPAQAQKPASPYDFGSFSNHPSAYSSPPQAQSAPQYGQSQHPSSTAYPPPPPSQAPRPSAQNYSSYNSASQPQSQPQGYNAQQSYHAPPSQPGYTSPPPASSYSSPPPQATYGSYPSHPQPAQPSYSQPPSQPKYPSHPPPSQPQAQGQAPNGNQASYYPAPPSRPAYASPPPQQQQQPQYPNYPPPTGYQQQQQPQQSQQYSYPSGPAPQQSQQPGQWGYDQAPQGGQGGYQYR